MEDLIKKVKSLSEKAEYERILEGLKNRKSPFLKHEKSLKEEQRHHLIQVKNILPILKVMAELKEQVIKVFEHTNDWYTGVFKLGLWLAEAQKYFPKSHNTVIRWFDKIIADFERGITNGMVGGINNQLKLIKRSGYGFINFDNFRVSSLLNWHLSY
ncbi:hypothetical protein B7486_24030 [cyanobacterium TDX16]|nr:hypothetical protein B7486_24030 [cyanobacterium TDX16]